MATLTEDRGSRPYQGQLPAQAAGSAKGKSRPRVRRPKPSLRKRIMALLVTLMMIATLLGVGELYCRVGLGINLQGVDAALFVPGRFGKSFGNAVSAETTVFGVRSYTDDLGFRIDPANGSAVTETHDARDAVLILGDSVAFGVGVEANQTFTGRLRRDMPQIRFYNSGVVGYYIQDYERVVDHFLPSHPEVRSVLLVYCLNDNSRANAAQIDKALAKPDVKNEQQPKGIARARRIPIIAQVNAFLRSRSALYLLIRSQLRDTPAVYYEADLRSYTDEVLAVNLKPLERIQAALAKRNVGFQVFIVPYSAQLRDTHRATEPQQMLSKLLTERGIDHVDLRPAFADSGIAWNELFLFADPMHLSPAGHKHLGQALRTALEREGLGGQRR